MLAWIRIGALQGICLIDYHTSEQMLLCVEVDGSNPSMGCTVHKYINPAPYQQTLQIFRSVICLGTRLTLAGAQQQQSWRGLPSRLAFVPPAARSAASDLQI